MKRPAIGPFSLSLIVAWLLVPQALAANYRVNSTGDSHDERPGDRRCAAADGQCTLRAAIEEANASRGPDTIGFRLERGATIVMSLGQLEIAGGGALKIHGPGAAFLTLDGNASSRLIRVYPDSTADISGLTLHNGYVDQNEFGDREFGAGVANLGTLTLRGVAVTGNRAPAGGGGILNTGTLSLIRSTVSGNSAVGFAGGILNGGEMLLVDSLVSDNDASDGAGGIDNRGTATLTGSVVRGNVSSSSSHAGGIDSRGTLSLVESTVSGNSGDGGVGGIENFGSLSLFGSVVTGNRSNLGGGIAGTRGEIAIAGSRVTGNTGITGPLDPSADCILSPIAIFRSEGNNLFGEGTGCTPGARDALAAPVSGEVHAASVGPDAPNFAVTASVVDIRVAASSDDAEESSSGSVGLSSSDLELVYDNSIQKVGMRFGGVAVPRGATITNAWVQFTVDEAQSEATSVLIQGQAIDNAPTFLSSSGNISGRTRTLASVRWDPVPWSVNGQAGVDQRTPSLAAVIQEIVSRQGWSTGNALALLITGTGHRTAVAYNGDSSMAPLLHIEYQAASGVNTAPVVSAGPDKSVTLPSGVSLAGTVTDDGLPNPPAAVTCGWSTTSGPGQAVFVNAASPSTTATFPASGTYVLRLTCSDSLLQAFDEVSITVSSATSGIAVYAGYYDTHHSSNLKPRPDPWSGSSGVLFVGNPDDSSGGWDTSTIRVDNLSGSTLTSVVVTVDIGSHHYALWGTNSIPAGGKLIVAQTALENFDGSDLNSAGCYSCDSSLCTTAVSSTIPVVHVTADGQTYNISDLGQILNTHGVDSAGCPYTGTRNDESQNWIRIK